MESIYTVKDLMNDEYTVIEYEKIRSRYGSNYIITAIADTPKSEFTNPNENKIRFFSNSYLAGYIDNYHPNKKFKIILCDGLITVPGYMKKKDFNLGDEVDIFINDIKENASRRNDIYLFCTTLILFCIIVYKLY